MNKSLGRNTMFLSLTLSPVYVTVVIPTNARIGFIAIFLSHSHLQVSTPLAQGSPTTGPWTGTGPRAGRYWAVESQSFGKVCTRASACTSPLLYNELFLSRTLVATIFAMETAGGGCVCTHIHALGGKAPHPTAKRWALRKKPRQPT